MDGPGADDGLVEGFAGAAAVGEGVGRVGFEVGLGFGEDELAVGGGRGAHGGDGEAVKDVEEAGGGERTAVVEDEEAGACVEGGEECPGGFGPALLRDGPEDFAR